jgi:hypothetical protein
MDVPDRAAPRDAQRGGVETTERRCSACNSEQVSPIGQIIVVFGVIKSSYECETCEQRFVFIRPLKGGSQPPLRDSGPPRPSS